MEPFLTRSLPQSSFFLERTLFACENRPFLIYQPMTTLSSSFILERTSKRMIEFDSQENDFEKRLLDILSPDPIIRSELFIYCFMIIIKKNTFIVRIQIILRNHGVFPTIIFFIIEYSFALLLRFSRSAQCFIAGFLHSYYVHFIRITQSRNRRPVCILLPASWTNS